MHDQATSISSCFGTAEIADISWENIGKGKEVGRNEPPNVYKLQTAYFPAPDLRLATGEGNRNGEVQKLFATCKDYQGGFHSSCSLCGFIVFKLCELENNFCSLYSSLFTVL